MTAEFAPAASPTPVVFYAGEPVTVSLAAQGGTSLRQPRWGLPDAVIAIVGSIVVAVLVAVLAAFVGPTGVGAATWLLLLSLSSPWLALAGWPLLAVTLRGNGPRIDLGFRWDVRCVGAGIVGGVVALLLGSLIAAITARMAGDFSSAAGDLAKEFVGQPVALAVYCLAVAVGAPFVEEICFRGILWNSLAKRGVRPWMVTVVSAVVFSLFHFEPVRFVLLLGTGLVLGHLRQRTGTITAPIVAHMVNNLVGVAGLLLSLR